MENGGNCFFNFIVDAHLKMYHGQLRLRKWRKYSKYLLWRLCIFLQWMHSIGCCHLDISLENLLVSDVKWLKDPQDPGYYILDDSINIRLCDFGLAEIFRRSNVGNIDFSCNKYGGKLAYLSPQIACHQKSFQANKSDIWSLGVVFFAVAVGKMPYEKPKETDNAFKYIMHGKISELMRSLKCLMYVSKDMLDLMHHMLIYDEYNRFNIEQVLAHPWFSAYQKQHKQVN